MDNEKHEDCPFDVEGWNDLDIFLSNYGIDLWRMLSEIINER